MFSDPLVAPADVDSGSAVTKSFTIINNLGTATDRVNFAAAVGEPRVLKISHKIQGKGVNAKKRSMVRLESYGVVDSAEDVTKVASLYVVADFPVSGITTAQKKQLWQQLVGLIRGGSGNVTYDSDVSVFFDRFCNGEA